MAKWSEEGTRFLSLWYAEKGKMWCAKKLNKTEGQIRSKAARLKLYQDKCSDFAHEWQKRAAKSKVGKKRPEQAHVMRALKQSGRLTLSEEGKKAIGLATKKRIASKGHMRGMLGKKHSPENKARFSIMSKDRWKAMTKEQKMEKSKKMIHTRHLRGKYATHRVTCTWKAAWREFGGKRHFYRSKWEANYARYLEFLKSLGKIKDWLHEPDVFWFKGIKRGCVSYLPDFKIINNDDSTEYHEVKGWMDDRSVTKIKRMAKYHPSVKLIIIKQKEYNEILTKLSRLIEGWE